MGAKIKDFVKNNLITCIATIIAASTLFWAYGCESQVPSFNDPARFVNRSQLQAEFNFLLAQIENKFEELNRKDEFKNFVFNSAITYAEGGTVNPLGLLITLSGILGIGATTDNLTKRRKERKILNDVVKNNKQPNST